MITMIFIHLARLSSSVRGDADCAEYNREKKETLHQFRDDFVESTGSVDLDKVTMQVNCRVPTSLTT